MVGAQVWLEDPIEAWIDGEIVEVNGEDIKVLCSSGKTVSNYFHKFYGFDIIDLP